LHIYSLKLTASSAQILAKYVQNTKRVVQKLFYPWLLIRIALVNSESWKTF